MTRAVSFLLPRDRSAPAQARRLVAGELAGMPRKRRHVAQLLVSELVSNAVVHGRGAIELTVDAARGRFEVRDDGGGTRRPRVRDDPGPDGGWGLRLVDELAARWGLREGKTCVWFEI